MPSAAADRLQRLQAQGLLESASAFLPASPGSNEPHRLSGHVPAWAYCDPARSDSVKLPQNRKIYEVLPPDAPMGFVARRTSLTVLLGASLSREFLFFLKERNSVVLVFEPERRRLHEFLEALDPEILAGGNVFIFAGDPDRLRSPLTRLLPRELFRIGYPAFYIRAGLEEAHPGYAARLIEQLEFFYYRNSLYQLFGPEYSRSLPLRGIRLYLYFDQLQFFYQNIPVYRSAQSLEALSGSLAGRTAILALSGPGLTPRLDMIRQSRGDAVLIAVTTSLHALLAAGIEPDFVLMADTSAAITRSFEGIERPLGSALVGHCLSFLATPAFTRKYVYGQWIPEVFGERPDLHTHGSVITTGLAFARLLGCSTLALAGANLSGPDPWKLSYAEGTIHHQAGAGTDRELPNRWPQLYPVPDADGRTVFTTLNFRDTALWFQDEIAETPGPRIVNTNADSILHGPGITVDPEFRPAPDPTLRAALRAALDAPAPHPVTGREAEFIARELAFWTDVEAQSAAALAGLNTPEEPTAQGLALVRHFDANGATYVLHRFRDFHNAHFCRQTFSPDSAAPGIQAAGLRYYFTHMRDMANHLAALLSAAQA